MPGVAAAHASTQLVALAQLLGSDYTDGVHGVGIVTAMETITAFGASLDGLGRFARWVRRWRGDDESTRAEGDDVAESDEEDKSERRRAFERRHRTVRRNWVLPDGFPSRAVAAAYLKPVVDTSEAPLSWARPNLHALREFCADKFGWTHAKADESLLPMMAEIEKGHVQSRIDAHFAWEKRFARVGSVRLASAIRLQNGGAPLPNAPQPKEGEGEGASAKDTGGSANARPKRGRQAGKGAKRNSQGAPRDGTRSEV